MCASPNKRTEISEPTYPTKPADAQRAICRASDRIASKHKLERRCPLWVISRHRWCRPKSNVVRYRPGNVLNGASRRTQSFDQRQLSISLQWQKSSSGGLGLGLFFKQHRSIGEFAGGSLIRPLYFWISCNACIGVKFRLLPQTVISIEHLFSLIHWRTHGYCQSAA